jgi:hypothetical protein
LRVRKNSKIVAERLSGVLFVPTHKDAAPADGRELLLEDVSALSLLLAPPLLARDLPSAQQEIADADFLQDGGLATALLVALRPGVGRSALLAVEADVDLLEGSADGLPLQGPEVGVLLEVA